LRGDSQSLVSESVDSRNHALAGLGVIAGLISVAAKQPTVDTVIGLVLAFAILRSSVLLVTELVRSGASHQPPDLSRYSVWAAERLEIVIRRRLEAWLLHLVGTQHVTGRADLLRRAGAAVDPAANPLLREYGMELDTSRMPQAALCALIERGLLSGADQLTITSAGRRQLGGPRRPGGPRSGRMTAIKGDMS
jgi:hypothetical protein